MSAAFGTSPAPGPAAPGAPIPRYLRDPDGTVHDLLTHLSGWATGAGRIAGPVALATLVSLLAARAWWRARGHRALTAGARLITILAPPTVDPAGATALWSNLVGLLRPAWRRRLSGQPHVAFEYVFTAEGVQLRLWVPGAVPPGLVERAVEAAWPGARTTTPSDTSEAAATAATPDSVTVSGGELRLARCEALPIRTDFAADPLRALLGAPTGLGAAEQAIVQVLARPVTGHRVTQARRAAGHLHTGRSTHPVGRLLDSLTPHPPARRGSGTASAADRMASLEHTAQDRAAATKLRGGLFETTVRYAITAALPVPASRAARAQARDRVRGRAHAIGSAFAAFTEHNHYRRRRLRHPAAAIAARRLGEGDLLSIPELAAIAHIPTDEAVAGLARAGARAVPPPPGIPTPGSGVKPLGVSDAGRRRRVGLAVADARQHLHLLGATGSGKSTLMAQLILADANAGRGAVVIDPKGDLITDVLDRLPADATGRVVLFDADARGKPPCLNPLDGGQPDIAVDNLVSIFARVYAANWGPRTDDILRAACLTLRAQPGVATLADLPRLLGEPAYRTRALAAVTDPVLRGFWAWYDQLSDASRSQVIAPLMNKLRAFLLRPFVKAALAAGPSTLDMPRILDRGGLCLVRIPKGSLGEDTTRLVGSLVVARVWQTATGRARLPQQVRADCGLYLDECQNFLNLPYPLEDMLAEARGFRLSMTLAHQHLGQLPRELKEGISANARSKIFFTASPEDARELARHTAPRLTEHDLAHLDAFHAAARLVVNGEQAPPFTLATEALPPPVPGRRRAISRAATNARPTEDRDHGLLPATLPAARDPRRAA